MNENKSPNFVYIGTDKKYWEGLIKRLHQDYPAWSFKTRHLPIADWKTIQDIPMALEKEKFDLIVIDMSKLFSDMCTLARTLERCFNHIPTLGLLGPRQGSMEIFESITAGLKCCHIKSGELMEASFQIKVLMDGFAKPKERMAQAHLASDEISYHFKVLAPTKIGFITEGYIHLETDMPLPEDRWIDLEWDLSEVLSLADKPQFRLTRALNSNFYYNFDYAYDLDFLWKEELDLKSIRQEITSYIVKHSTDNKPKRTRMLIVTDHFKFLKDADNPIDSYPYSIRYYRNFRENLLQRIYPGIVVLDLKSNQENQEDLQELVKTIVEENKRVEQVSPIIILFNHPDPAQVLINRFSYKKIITHREKFEWKTLLDICKNYEDKGGRLSTHDQGQSYHKDEERLYLGKDNPLSFAHYPISVEIRSFNELMATLECKEELPERMVVQVKKPVPFSMTLYRDKDTPPKHSENKCYLGLVHGVHETDRAKLRAFVNKLIGLKDELEEEKERQAMKAKGLEYLNKKSKNESEN